MSYDRYERRRLKYERKLTRRLEREQVKVPVDVALPVEGLSGPELENQLRKRAQMRIARRNNFYKSLIAYVAVNLLLWTIWFASWSPGQATFPWPIIVTIAAGLSMLSEAYSIYQDSTRVTERREDQIQREIELERMRLGLSNDVYEKPKRDHAVRLSDDGELIPDDEEDIEPSAKPKRGQF